MGSIQRKLYVCTFAAIVAASNTAAAIEETQYLAPEAEAVGSFTEGGDLRHFAAGPSSMRAYENARLLSSDATDGEIRSLQTGGVAVGKGAGEEQLEFHGTCRWVDARNATAGFFVPNRTAEEFAAFAQSSNVAGAVIEPCSCPSMSVTVMASTGATATARLASNYPQNGDGRPNPISTYNQGKAVANIPVASGCETWVERVEYAYACSLAGWQLSSIARSPGPRDSSACAPEPEPEPPVVSWRESPVVEWTHPVEPTVVIEPSQPVEPSNREPVIACCTPQEPDPPVRVAEPVVVEREPQPTPTPVVEEWDECTRWGQNDINFRQIMASGQGGAFYGACQ